MPEMSDAMEHEKMNINSYIFQYLDSITSAELQRKIDANDSLVHELRPYAGMVRLAKGFSTVQVDGDNLLLDLYRERRDKAEILLAHRRWYERQIDELQTFVNSL